MLQREVFDLILVDTTVENSDTFINDALVYGGYALFTNQVCNDSHETFVTQSPTESHNETKRRSQRRSLTLKQFIKMSLNNSS